MTMSLLEWRRRTAAIYAAVRAEPEPEAAHWLWRRQRGELFATHPDSAWSDALSYAPYDPAWRFVVPVEGDLEPAHLDLPTATDGVVPFDRVGRVQLDGVGTLDLWWLGSYGGGLWLPIRGARSDAVYGGGRYVLDTAKGADLGGGADGLVVDLNFAYNPSCAYDPAWACPLPPPGNTVDVALEVGELAPSQGG